MSPRPAMAADDRTAIQHMASRRWPQGWHPGGLGWWLARRQLDDKPTPAVVVLDDPDGAVGAWATRGQHDEGEVSVQVDAGRDGMIDATLDWALDGLDGVRITIEVYAGDTASSTALEARGFAPDAGLPVVGMFRASGAPPPDETRGYRVRAVTDAELDDRVEVHRRAWKPASLPWADGRTVDPDAESPFSRSAYDAVRSTWLYRQELDLVAEAPDGSLAACCIAWFDPATGVAEIEPVGVDPTHRRRGLAVELCLEVARQVEAIGGHELFLNVAPSPEYPANAAAYAKAGFRVVQRGVNWVRPRAS
ncbi:MAG: GNAT family N-acetyltransferase [Acidimicrobiales bacterium]